MSDRPFLILIVLDGFGCTEEREWNAIAKADAPRLKALRDSGSWTLLEASGERVGLPAGQMGNSEVGHLNIGAGRVVDQDVVRISKAIDSGRIGEIAPLREAFELARRNRKPVHFIGLLSDGGVHSFQRHLHGLLDAAIAAGVHRDGIPSLFVHAILDGRDTPPRSAERYLGELMRFLESRPDARLASIVGRYFAMDRDRRWDRVQRAWDLFTLGIGNESKDPIACIRQFYEQGITDEFMPGIAVAGHGGEYRGKIEDDEPVILFNFRADRMRQLVSAFRDDEFDGFERTVRPRVPLLTMTRYHRDWTDIPAIFPPERIADHLGEVLSAAGLRQLRIAETEKYAHVTFFFNGGSDSVSEGEERILVPSPKVATYDLQPEMSLPELSSRVVDEIRGGGFDVIVLNVANPDMVGHTGIMPAAVRAIEATDQAIGRILDATAERRGVALITADHGNCEIMWDPSTRQPHTAHTTSPVPLILVDSTGRYGRLRDGGALENVAPTVLDILGIGKPEAMTAASLLEAVTG